MRNFFIKSLSFLKWVFFLLLIIILSTYFILRSSLPDLDGQKTMTLLDQSVQIERDKQGIPTIQAKSRKDTAFALGYVHAQERFFQMDLLRKSAAGELSKLFGDATLDKDTLVKVHRFRDRAKNLLRRLPKAQYTVIQAYADGVNSGIDNLSNVPFQYLLLRQKPELWVAEDSLLCIYAMYLDLNDELGERETSLAILKEKLPLPWFNFLNPKGGVWDAPMDGLALPESETFLAIPRQPLPESIKKQQQASHGSVFISDSGFLFGSNSWVIDASLTSSSSAMLANDLHLTLRVPNIWYRASWYLEDGRRMTGVTLPGVPTMVVGSNEKIAWGFTNSYGDWGDIIILQTNAQKTQYLTPKGWKNFTIYDHSIQSHRGNNKEHITIETIWGPVIGTNHKGEMIVHQWLAYAPQAVNFYSLQLERALTVDEALTIAPEMGLPPQNMLLADYKGHIAWTIAGTIPKREKAVADQRRHQGWSAYQAAKKYPVFKNPENHRLWTANNRVISGYKLAMVGFEGGDLGARAQQIRDNLLAKDQFQESDLLAIQLDSSAVFLQRWKQLLSDSIADSNEAIQVEMTDVLNKEQNFAAHSDSVSYGLVRAFRNIIVNQTIGWIYDILEKSHPRLFKRSTIDNLVEYPVWELVSNKPQHLVPAGYANWDEFIFAASSLAYNEINRDDQESLQQQTWGKQHKTAIRHSLSAAIPGLGLLLDMPSSPLSGDDNMPKVLNDDFGASMRMVVTPGQEENGIMHMPAGQSSHPLSSYYSHGHQDWVDGKPSSFLPGKSEWLLELKSIQ